MAEHRHLSHPPLREAIIDIRLANELPSSFVERMSGQKVDGFEASVPIWRRKFTLQLGLEESSVPGSGGNTNERFGWRYTTTDGSKVCLFRRDGATFSVLRGYTNWEEAKASARNLWEKYCTVGSPKEVSRLAVRYINVLDIPGATDIDLYLTAGPRIPPQLPQVLNGFLHRMVIPFSSDGTTAIVTQALEPPSGGGVPIVLDIDVAYTTKLEVNSPVIWAEFDRLRDIKNRIFFSSVTERALEPYK
jgi:uncharacterized protein (TIGR04255 family)